MVGTNHSGSDPWFCWVCCRDHSVASLSPWKDCEASLETRHHIHTIGVTPCIFWSGGWICSWLDLWVGQLKVILTKQGEDTRHDEGSKYWGSRAAQAFLPQGCSILGLWSFLYHLYKQHLLPSNHVNLLIKHVLGCILVFSPIHSSFFVGKDSLNSQFSYKFQF